MKTTRFSRLYAVLETPLRKKKFLAWLSARTGPKHTHLIDLAENWHKSPIKFQEKAQKVLEAHQIPWSNQQFHRELSDLTRHLEDFLVMEHITSRPLTRHLLLVEYLNSRGTPAALADVLEALTEKLGGIQPEEVSDLHQQTEARKWIAQHRRQEGVEAVQELILEIGVQTDKAMMMDLLWQATESYSWKRGWPEVRLHTSPLLPAVLSIASESSDMDVKLLAEAYQMTVTPSPEITQIQYWFGLLTEQENAAFVRKFYFNRVYSAAVGHSNLAQTEDADHLLWEVSSYGILRQWLPIHPSTWLGIIRLAARVLSWEAFSNWFKLHNIASLLPAELPGIEMARPFFHWQSIVQSPESDRNKKLIRESRKSLLTLKSKVPFIEFTLSVLRIKIAFPLELEDADSVSLGNLRKKIRTLQDQIEQETHIQETPRKVLLKELELIEQVTFKQSPARSQSLREQILNTSHIRDKNWLLHCLKKLSPPHTGGDAAADS